MNMRKELTKHKAVACDNEGYDKYFILDGKKMNVENFDMSGETVKKGTPSELKRIFGKSMAIDWFQSSFKQIYTGGCINKMSQLVNPYLVTKKKLKKSAFYGCLLRESPVGYMYN